MQQNKPLIHTKKKLVLLACMLSSAVAAAAQPAGEVLSQKAGIPWPTVIAHRGASYAAPEETVPAYTAARDIGADYLELDLQRTKDGVLIALHDNTLKRTTNVADVFPDRAGNPINTFTLAEIKQLDAGSWFNKAHPERARPGYVGLKILTLDEVIDIAQGGENHPGLYLETKVPDQFPGIEHDLQQLLKKRGLLDPVNAPAGFDKTKHNGTGFTNGRVILQTFEKPSLTLLNKEMPNVPKILLLWLGDGYEDIKGKTYEQSGAKDYPSYYANVEVKDTATFEAWLDFAKANGATGTGPAAKLKNGGEWSYMDMVKPWMNKMTHDKGMVVHAYTVDDPVDFKSLSEQGVDGFFTNRADVLLEYYGRKPAVSLDQTLVKIGYAKQEK